MSLDRRTPVLRSFDHVIPVLEAWRDLCVRRCERQGGVRLLCKCYGGGQTPWQHALEPHGLEHPAFPVIAMQYILRRSAVIRSERHLQPSMLKKSRLLS
jgi:hypothetical protein